MCERERDIDFSRLNIVYILPAHTKLPYAFIIRGILTGCGERGNKKGGSRDRTYRDVKKTYQTYLPFEPD